MNSGCMFSAFRTHQTFSDDVLTAEFEFDSKEKVFDKPNHTYPKGISQFRTVTEFKKEVLLVCLSGCVYIWDVLACSLCLVSSVADLHEHLHKDCRSFVLLGNLL